MNDSPSALEESVRLRRKGMPHVLVTVVAARGSTPQDTGAKMVVTAAGRLTGTVGGGKIEAAAIAYAVDLLATGAPAALVAWNLQRDIGMTCGGEMQLFFDPSHGAHWVVAIFGAGHVAQALVRVLAPMDCLLFCFDSRREWIDRLPTAPNVRATLVENLAAAVPALPPSAFVLTITQGHATDCPILRAALEREFPFIGAIGSKSKRAALDRDLREAGLAPERIARLHCPLGLPIGTNHPQEIAVSIAAGLLQARDATPITGSKV
jgi:xanthine dehydrogenase accessory factor